MTQFIIWPKTIDISFRADYLTEVGEKIQDSPLESNDDLSYLIGSSRVIQTNLDNLAVTHTDMDANEGSPPTAWVPVDDL